MNGGFVVFGGFFDISKEEFLKVYDETENIINTFNAENDGTLEGFMSSFDTFPFLHIRSIFVSNAVQGVGISLLMSFAILVITSKNVYISMFAIGHILAIIVTLMSMISFFGWSFGIVESTSVIVFVGISFDYVVHICHSYNHALYWKRKQRMDQAYT